MSPKKYNLPSLYKVCILGDNNFFSQRVGQICWSLSVPERAPALSPWGRLIRMAADKISNMDLKHNMDDAQRSLPFICSLPSKEHGPRILLALQHIGPLMPLPIQFACAEACADVGNQQEIEAILDFVEPSTAEKWLERLSQSSRAAGHSHLARSLDERLLSIFENREIASQSKTPITTKTSLSARRL